MYSATKIPYIRIIFTFVICFLAAWLFTKFLYSYWTSSGEIYYQSLNMDSSEYSNERVVIYGTEDYYDRFWVDKYDSYRYDVYIGGTTAFLFYVGKIENIENVANKQWSVKCDIKEQIGYAIFWVYSGTASRNLEKLYGTSSTQGCQTIVGFTGKNKLTPYARNVELVIPIGGLSPLMYMLLDQGTKGLNTSMDSKISKAMNVQLVGEINSKLRLKDLNSSIEDIAFKYGPIQFLTVLLLFFCLLVLFTSMFQSWAAKITEGMLDLIPYVGFFGTLLGMGAALSILGDANLSDPISKAISLGPIGSKLSLAIETTKFALVCFGLGTFFLVVRNTFKSDYHRKTATSSDSE